MNSGPDNEESSNFSVTAETWQQHQVDTGSVNSYNVPVSEDDRHVSVTSSEKPVTVSSG